ncbi:MAG TPA: FAD-dependent oxidoreductase [Pirellulaceae bacterium]|nr:FAD-dependent oxidoreductase [Pirellulaceae bacterium]
MPVETHELCCDVLVAGGGPAGVPCAIAAARCGATVILCQDRPVLGGNASSEVRMHIVGANGTGSFDRGESMLTEAREGGIIEEIRLEAAVRNPQRSASMFDLILYEKCRSEPNLKLLLNTTVTGVEHLPGNDKKVDLALAQRQSTEDQFRIRAHVFVDCTGDGRLGVEAGAAFMRGRESREQFGESLAGDTPDASLLGSTILLTARKHNRPLPFVAPHWVRTFAKDELRLRLYAVPGEEDPTHEYGYWWAEWGGTLDTIKENETIRDELLAITLGIWNHIKNGPPGTPEHEDPFEAACWALDWIGFLPGKRESRRFIGQHILTQKDVQHSRTFADAIAYGGWPLDLHPPAGVDATDEQPCQQHDVPWLYDIPLRCCVSRDVENLMFAGRNISASHVAFSSTRVMATCAAVGQGVGTAAAMAVREAVSPIELAARGDVLDAIQKRLLRDDVYLIGRIHDDPQDLAKTARITASSSQPGGEAVQVVTGQTRSVHGDRGAPPDRSRAGLHRWASDPMAGLPAWLQLDWELPVRLTELQLIFDSGLHRHLTLSHHDGYTARMMWGQPQGETVSDYAIEGLDGERWVSLATVASNYQRRRCHAIESDQFFTSVRVTVIRTNGLDHARICGINVRGTVE